MPREKLNSDQQERREKRLAELRLQGETPDWKQATAKTIDEMKQGKGGTLKELETIFKRG